MARGPRTHSVVSPEPGTASVVLAFALAYAVVDRATEGVVAVVEAAGVPPETLTTGLAGVLWLALAALVGTELLRQYRANPRSFGDRDVRRAFLDAHRPAPRDHAVALAGALGGGAIVVVARGEFYAALDGTFRVLRLAVAEGRLGSFSPVTFAAGALFVVGFAAFAYGTDRAIVGLSREALYRYYR